MSKRMKTRDVAFPFRMTAGFPGDVNRSHPVNIEPALNDPTTPVTAFGQAVKTTTSGNSVRPFAIADQSNTVPAGYGISVRPYPFQGTGLTAAFGAASIGAAVVPPGAIDILKAGYIVVQIPASQAALAIKGNPVYVWCAASSGIHVLGGLETTYSASNTTQLLNAFFNGPADASGNVEIIFNV